VSSAEVRMGTELMARDRRGEQPGKAEADGERPKRARRTAPVQVEKELARMVAVIASHRGISQSDFLSPFIKQYVITNYRQVRGAMGKELDELDDQSDGGGSSR
jgi:hypothetical protein